MLLFACVVIFNAGDSSNDRARSRFKAGQRGFLCDQRARSVLLARADSASMRRVLPMITVSIHCLSSSVK